MRGGFVSDWFEPQAATAFAHVNYCLSGSPPIPYNRSLAKLAFFTEPAWIAKPFLPRQPKA